MSIQPVNQFKVQLEDGAELLFLSAAARNAYTTDSNAAAVQETRDVDGTQVPVWDVELLVKTVRDGVERFGSLTVRVATPKFPAIAPMTPVDVHGLMGTSWKLANGNGGFSVRADGIAPKAAAQAQQVRPPEKAAA